MKTLSYFSSISVLALLFLSTNQIQAQQKPDDYHAPSPGDKALQFQISDNFNLSSFSGSAISLTRQVTDKRSHRYSFSFGNRYHHNDRPNNGEREEYNNSWDNNISASFTWKNYTNPEALIKFYYGFGPHVSFDYDKDVTQRQNSKQSRTVYDVGIGGLGYIGTEWFFHPSISIHAEYRASFTAQYSYRKDKVNDFQNDITNSQKLKEKGIELGSNGVRFGISVYF